MEITTIIDQNLLNKQVIGSLSMTISKIGIL